jgi:hypothetical protein
MFSFENGPDIEMVSNASKFLGYTLNTWDNDHAVILYLKDSCFSMASLWSQQILVGIHQESFRLWPSEL